jgi:hypothetical protein
MWHNARLLNLIASALYALVALMALGLGCCGWRSGRCSPLRMSS